MFVLLTKVLVSAICSTIFVLLVCVFCTIGLHYYFGLYPVSLFPPVRPCHNLFHGRCHNLMIALDLAGAVTRAATTKLRAVSGGGGLGAAAVVGRSSLVGGVGHFVKMLRTRMSLQALSEVCLLAHV